MGSKPSYKYWGILLGNEDLHNAALLLNLRNGFL